jgi:hypothetical protein
MENRQYRDVLAMSSFFLLTDWLKGEFITATWSLHYVDQNANLQLKGAK